MGLDNGIMLHGIKPEEIPPFIKYYGAFDDGIELCYWRKCWGIRNKFLDILTKAHPGAHDYKIDIDFDDVPALERALMQFTSESYWDENAESIWTYEEFIPHLIDQIVALRWLAVVMCNNPHIQAEFYDSY